ncbi:ABC transporter permease [Acuticoccus mangrovi]|uniref:ABC transporter permease n=1 Tax=Acuticoccus mangrovi TaxID=2796142 RepID=A0A934IGX0_9HYPH|nr:ABC transporter permease [Acuticoccus mangrovi]MBJ3776479.1 ABC transporter permease [Acuticoccus mangrovi]
MVQSIANRLISTVPILFVVSVLIFSLLYLTPGDPAQMIAGAQATQDDVERIREALGLNDPALMRYFDWLWDVLHFDFGRSVFNGRSVTELIMQRMEPTFSLMALTTLFAIVIAVPLGVLAAWRANSVVDRIVLVLSIASFSIPVFVTGYVLAYYVAFKTGLLPVQGYAFLKEGVGEWLAHLVLPSVSLGLIYVALISRITRASMLEVLSEDYIRTARAKGLLGRRILFVHALRNAANPIVTVVGVGVALLLGGAVVIESVFNIPGIGRLTVDAILRRDYPIIQGVMLLFAMIYIVVNLIIDLLYTVFDPRIRY